jgi:thiol-disulfide isomerase/thioredoxin
MKNKNQMIAFVRKYRKKLDTLDVGACFMVPGMIANQQEGQNPFVVLLEKTDGKQFRFTLINTGHIGREYHYMSATSAPPKIQTRQVMVFNNVAADKVLDDGWWLMFWRLMMGGNAAMLYDDLLPLLLGQPLTAALEANSNHTDDLLAPLRTNQRSGCTGYRVLREAWTYYLLQHGVTVDHTLQVAFMYQQQWAKLVLHDMNVCNDLGDQVDESDIGLIKLVINHLCHVATVKVRFDDAPRFLTEQLDDLRRTVMHLTETYETLTIRTYGATKRSLELDDPTALAISTGDLIHDFYDHFLRKEDVNGLAGPAKTKPGFVPIDFLLVPEQATTFDEAIDALRWADKICTLVSVQTIHVQNPQFLKAALLQHLFTKIVTVPTVGDATCYWSPPMRYALQLDVILLLKRLLEHFVSSVFAINTTREFDAVRIVVTSVIMTIADVMLRKVATDIPSEVSTVWNQQGYGIKLAPFDLQSETIMTTVPELNIARTRVLDYWYDLNISPDKQVFNWNDSMYPDAPTMGFLGQVCSIMAFPQGQNVPVYLSGEAWLILKNYPEFEYYRDIVFYAKYMLADSKFHPPTAPYNQKMAELGWAFKQGKYVVGAFRMELVCQAKDHRWESYAVAQRFTNPHQALNEDDLLHIREFDFCEGQLGQRDSELILSYLTVPYMRIPLVLSFFATEDRIHSLKSETLKHLLDSVVFEPARYLHKNSAGAPQFVPAKNERLLNTAYGLLINELARSPSQVVTALIHLLKLALALDTGSYFASQTDIILYVIRLATRIENFILFVLSYAAGEFVTMQLRDTVVEPAVVTFLEESRQELRDIFENRVQTLLRRWIRECIKRAHALQEAERSRGEQDAQEPGEPNPAAASQLEQFRAQREQDSKTAGGFLDGGNNIPQDDEEEFFTRRMNRNRSPQKTQKIREVVDEKKKKASTDYDALFQIACNLRAHTVMTMRNSRPAEWNALKCERFLSLMAFLNSRHTWNADLLYMPEPEIWEILQFCRRTLIRMQTEFKLQRSNRLLESVVALVADAKLPAPESFQGWGRFIGRHQAGRYAVVESSARCALLNSRDPERLIPRVNENSRLDMGIEFNLQIAQLTLKSNHIEALKEPMSQDYDVLTVFGPRSLQCIVIEDARRRTWFRLLGRNHDLQYWDPDDRTAIQEFDREYDPSECPPTEHWIVRLFEPIRRSYYVPPAVPAPIPFMLPETILGADEDIAILVGLHPEEGGVLIEVTLCKSLGVVNISYIESVGRYFWRTQMYASDARFSNRFLQPSFEDRRNKWPAWGRYEAGRAGLPSPVPTALITREATLKDNLSGTTETFIPCRYLYGVLPQALIDGHRFWMDDNDNLRGYPLGRDKKTGVYEYVILIEIEADAKKRHMLGVNSKITKRMLQSVRMDWTEEELMELRRTQETTDDETGIYNEHGCRNRPTKSSRELDRGVYDEKESLELLNPFYAHPDSKLRSTMRCLARIETMSHMLFWKKVTKLAATDLNTIDLIELPRLQLTLTERNGCLFSIDHADLRVTSEQFLLDMPEVVHLCRGIPHSLVMVNSNNEPSILMPLIRVVRPAIGSSPLTTELVLDRVNWGGLATKTLLLPVHISLSFLQTPNLMSALYLLHLRFVNRDYTDAMRLVSSVGTDTVLSAEETAVTRSISSVIDSHPNAHSLRLHLSLALMDAPEQVKSLLSWDIPDQETDYMNKLTYVAMSSRIDARGEADIVDAALEQIRKEDVIKKVLQAYPEEEVKAFWAFLSDPSVALEVSFQEKKRFEEMMENIMQAIESSLQISSGMVSEEEIKRLIPKALSKQRSIYQRLMLKNRKRWLATPVGESCVIEEPDRRETSNWQWWTDDTVARADESHWIQAEFKSGNPRSLTGTQLLDNINQIISQKELMNGFKCQLGFLFLYNVLTGSVKIRVGSNDDSWTIARLLWHYYGDGQGSSLWSSIISIFLANPHLRDFLPVFRDNRKSKTELLLGMCTDEAPICPVNDLLRELVPILQSTLPSLAMPTIPRKSAPRPVGDLDPDHKGLTVVVASSFADIVMSTSRVFLDVYADWCRPCQAIKPHVMRVARVLAEMNVPDLIVAKGDSDKNDFGSFISETYIPVLKFYAPGQPAKLYEGSRDGSAILRFLHQECKGTSSAFDFQLATDLLASIEAEGYPQRGGPVATDAVGDQKHSSLEVFLSMEDNRAERRPRISNYLCNERKLRAVDLSVLESLEADEKKLASLTTLFTVTEDQLNDFATQPLKCLDFARFISSSEGKASEPVSFSMPFDVSNHPDSKSPVCVEMTNLFTTDLKNYEDIMNAKRPTNLVVDMLSESVSLADKLALLTDLEQVAIAQRGRDLIWVQTAFSTLHAWSNHVNMENDGKSAIGDMFAGRSGAFHYFLSRVAATESYLGAQFVIALLTCTDASTDMQQVNPFLTTEQTEELLALACLALCHSNRLGHVNRVLSTSRKLGKFLKQFHVMLESKEQNASAKIDVRQRIIQQLEGLTTDLLSKRYYMSQDRTFDPRYLVFEFIWNLMLREAQVEMIDEFMTTLNAGGSLCRQLIMGSGKTTVIAPMLCLMLGDQKHLVVEAVPPPLLEFSRACARSSFSAILQKRVYTFSFDRSSLMTEATLKKLRHARDDAGVVCTTPTAIKALLLRYIENNTNIRNSESNPNLANARRYAKFVANQEKIIEALNIFVQEGILLCDEIDMLLHPLRSELNFPIGEKHPLDFSPARWTYPMDILNTILIGDKVVTHGWTTEQIQKTMPLIRESTRLAEAVQAMTKVIA